MHVAAVALLGNAIYSEPTHRALLLPRADALFVVGANDFGLIRIKSFATIGAAERYIRERGWKIPTITPAHLQPAARTGKSLSANRMTWSDYSTLGKRFTPIVEANNAEAARYFERWIESGNLRESHLGYAVKLEDK